MLVPFNSSMQIFLKVLASRLSGVGGREGMLLHIFESRTMWWWGGEWEEHSLVQILCVMNSLLPDLLAENLSVLTAHSSVFREVGHALEDGWSSLMPLLLQVSVWSQCMYWNQFHWSFFSARSHQLGKCKCCTSCSNKCNCMFANAGADASLARQLLPSISPEYL